MNEAREVPQVDAREAQRRMLDGGEGEAQAGGAVLIDVREREEYDDMRAPGATLIPLSQFTRRFGEIPQDREALIICHSGYRSLQAAIYLRRQGYTRVGNVSGGMEAWEAYGLPVEHGKAGQ